MENQTIIEALLLGLLEGLTEFIPVSSTGHILLAGHFLGFESTGKAFEVLIQLGAILAILSVYAARFWAFLKRPDRFKVIGEVIVGVIAALIWMGGCAFEFVSALVRRRRPNLFLPPQLPDDPAVRMLVGLAIGFLPAAVIGVLAHGFIKSVLFESPMLICTTLLLGGVALLVIDRLPLKPRYHNAMDFPLHLCLAIGFVQCLAMVPGVSRSGSTIAGSLLMGTDKRSAAEFSFFLAMPTMAGAFAYDLYKNRDVLSMDDATIIAIGFVTSFVAAVFVVRRLLDFVSRHGFAPFAWWRIGVGLAGFAGLYFFG